ncbi:GGDEF domain-containing response regulator [Neomoorella mulderi]|uniref:Stage 0 sporulation protein A homolog n=1 Tax=Moorella mulderi DSM 14980 TaxID=1122241 RepID=A0A151ASP7_9FIRM|nr:diguanylate cyclase [Moorella mulderi]KYH30600.1 putative diguanylate cyclase YdaM [Moorella mulderi DSM 14980]
MDRVPGKKILIVEDSRLQAQIAADILSRHGYMTEIALTAEETLQKASGPECPDLILMDIDLGEGMDGTTLSRRIQQVKDIPVVFLTAISTREAVEQVRSVTRYGYVLKGAPEHVLVSTVEMALKLHEALSLAQMYRRIVEGSLTEVYIFHPDTLKFLAVNRGARENLGYTEEELLDMDIMQLMPEFDRERFRSLLAPLQQGEKEKIIFDAMHRRKDGSLYPVEAHLQLFGHGKDGIGVAFILDLTERRKMEEKLRQQGEFLQSLLAALPVGIFIIDPASHRIEEANLEAAAMIGAAPEEIAGRPCWEFFPQSAGSCPITVAKEEVDRSERLLRRKDGLEILVLKTVKRLRTDSGEKLVETFIDISERKHLEEELYRLSITDPLTGAYNRRYFLEMLEREIERTRRTGHPFALIMLDLDHFKGINDRFGHAAGDRVLKSLVAAFKERLRKTDCLARWGGEEFVILLPETGVEGAATLAEELRQKLSEMEIPGVGLVTASFGVTGYHPGDTVDAVTQRVDSALYRAKGNGRNCVCVGGPH